jgi:sortase (surface protein transpeptidase)
MDVSSTHRPRRRRLLAGLLAILALTLGVSGWARQTRHNSEPVRGPVAASTSTAGAPSDATHEQAHDARPTHLRISSIDVSAAITSLGIKPDRTVEVPDNPDEVGWYRLGSLPGQAGSAVILGHVDSTKGPAVFYRLRSLTPGATVEVENSDGSVIRFEVTSIATYDNEDFPARKVYRPGGRPGLALVTCGGRYDAAHGGYQANVVVFAALAGASR